MEKAALVKASQDTAKKNNLITLNNLTTDASILINGEHGMSFGPRCTGCKMNGIERVLAKAQGALKSTYCIPQDQLY